MKLVRFVSLLFSLLIFFSCAFWARSGNHIHNQNDGNVGIGTINPESKLTVVDETETPVRNFSGISSIISSPSEARAVYGAAIYPNSTYNYGGYFTSAGESSGVFGEASDKERGGYGGVFHSWGKAGVGVLGLALNTGDGVQNYGGRFDARGKKGIGIFSKGGDEGYAAKFSGNVLISKDSLGPAFVVDGKGGIGGSIATELKGGLDVKGGGFFSSQQGYAIWAKANGIADAALFDGKVTVTGALIKSGGGFKIDHPLYPEDKYLYHSYVESPDMMNVYNGNVTLDRKGEARVKLPAYFEALNRDFRYQLTAIGAPSPDLYVAKKVSGNSFMIAGGKPGMEVSWQVTGIRIDAYAKAHRIVSEVKKEPENQGKYIHPKELEKPNRLRIGWEKKQRVAEMSNKLEKTARLD